MTDDDFEQPRAVVLAERAVLGIVLDAPTLAGRVFGRVSVADFTGPRKLVAEAIHGVRLRRGGQADHVTVLAEMQRRGTVSRAGGPGVFADLATAGANPALLPAYLDEIVTDIRRRRLHAVGLRLSQLAGNEQADPLETARSAQGALTGLIDAAEADDGDVTTPTLREFLAAEDEPYDWVIPGLLERGDRLILTGSEGLGKSHLLRQIAVCTAAGVHPFDGRLFAPQPVLVVDCENGPVAVRRQLRPLAAQARTAVQGAGADNTLWVETRPEGLDLTKPADEAWLVRTVSALQPAMLITGSLYRLHAKNPNDEEPARAVTRVLDRCRTAANCAVVLEAHSPHSSNSLGPRPVRPVGSSLWLRWPEFGYGLRPTKDYTKDNRLVDLVAWRGDREARGWPRRLQAGGRWPWTTATYDPHNSWEAAS